MIYRLQTKEEARAVTLVKATALWADQTSASMLFQDRECRPIPQHLKRIKKTGSRLLFLACIGTDENIENGVPVEVPEFAPRTQEQYLLAREAWPCHYFHRKEETIDTARAMHFIQKILNGENAHKREDHPKYNKGTDIRGRETAHGTNKEECFCAGTCIVCDGDEVLAECYDMAYLLGHAILAAVEHVSRLKRGYLCTGFSAYLYMEPCVSCAMALVHGRIKRVFCCTKRPGAEAAFSGMRFNYKESLNHRYNVYFYSEDSEHKEQCGAYDRAF